MSNPTVNTEIKNTVSLLTCSQTSVLISWVILYLYCINVADPYGKLSGYVSRASTGVLWVEVGIWLTQEVWFQHVATSPVGQETTPVQIHLFPWCLEVQSHWKGARKNRHANYPAVLFA